MLIKRKRIELVYSNSYSGRYRSVIAYFAARISGVPFVWHIREMIGVHSRIASYVLSRAACIIAISEAVAGKIREHTSSNAIAVVYNGIDLTDVPKISRDDAKSYIHEKIGTNSKSCKVIINIGIVTKRKGQLLALEVASLLIQKDPTLHFCFVGETNTSAENESYFRKIQQKVLELSIEKNIHFVGFQSNIATWLQGADILMHTAEKEPFGRVILESMLAETPVVVYDVPGVNEVIVDDCTGVLVPFNNAPAMVEKIQQLLNSPDLRDRLTANARAYTEQNFSARTTALRIEELLLRLALRS